MPCGRRPQLADSRWRNSSHVRLEIGGDVLELSAASPTDQQRLIGTFIGRDTPAADSQ